jgi:hypothetical protein
MPTLAAHYAAPVSLKPIAELPVPSHDASVARLYDGCPDATFELPGAAPEFMREAVYKVPLRATVAVTQDEMLAGAALAFGAVSAQFVLSPDAQYVQVSLAWPQVRAWGQGQCDFLKERARVRCVEQYAQAALALARELEQAAPGACAVLSFSGDWDEQTAPLRRKLAARFLERQFGLARVRH